VCMRVSVCRVRVYDILLLCSSIDARTPTNPPDQINSFILLYSLIQVIKSLKNILVIVEYKYLKSFSRDLIVKNLFTVQDHAVLSLLLKIVINLFI